MLDRDGFVAETNATHLFLVEQSSGTVVTPTTKACPEGITRATVLDLCRRNGIASDVRDVSLAEFYRAAEVFCTGTMGELVPVTAIDGRTIGGGGELPGPVTRRLTDFFTALTRTEGVPVV